MYRAGLAALTLMVGCMSPAYELYLEHDDQSGSGSGSGDDGDAATIDTTPTSTGSTGSAGAGSSTGDTTGAPDDDAPSSDSGTTSATAEPPVGDADKPTIVQVDLWTDIHAAGPAPISVLAKYTDSVRVTLDGVDAGELTRIGGSILFEGAFPVRGAIDNGWHDVVVTASQGPHEDSRAVGYNVSTPEPGAEAWSLAGPDGSRTLRVVLTPEGDLIEVGQTDSDDGPRPAIRKRSVLDGETLWPEGTIVLDPREGSVVDVAVRIDGRMWVAMNVTPPGQGPRPRIALLNKDGQPTGNEFEGTVGQVVRALVTDADGGCFAVGVAGVMGDWDIAYWKIDGLGQQTLGGTFDYQVPALEPHSFMDLASDVVLDGDVAWIAGTSQGKHDLAEADPAVYPRGVLVPMNIHTGELAGSVVAAPAVDVWKQSAFFGAALHPEGPVVTGYACDATCSTYRIETSRYRFDGQRVWLKHEGANAGLAYGSDVALDSQGRVLVAGAVTQNGELHGYVFGRKLDMLGPIEFDHWYPGVGPSEVLGIVSDGFDRIFVGGYITFGGVTQARLTRIHG